MESASKGEWSGPDPRLCANCNAELAGKYCHECGQNAADPLRSVGAFITESLGDFVHLRSGTLLTLGTLLKPGRLTREYLIGRRARYVGPFQVYLLAAAVFFLASTTRPVVEFDAATGKIHSSLGIMTAGGSLDAEEIASIENRGISMPVFAERFASHVNATLPIFLILSLTLFVLLVRLFYVRQPFPAVAHAVFALHWSAFYLLVMVIERVMGPADVASALKVILAFGALIYLTLALKHTYQQSWLVTTIKSFAIFMVFNIILALWVAGVVALAMVTI